VDLLARLSHSLPLILLGLGFVLAVLVVVLFLFIRSRRAKPEEVPPEAAVALDFTGIDAAVNLHNSFLRGVRRLRRHVSGAGYRSEIPWVLLVGEEAAGKSALLAHSGLDLPMGPPEEGQGCAWWFFDRGVVLDVAPDFVLDASGRGSDELRWRQLLLLLERNRAERPIDSIVLALPAQDLALPGERTSDRLARAERKAAILAAKLRETQTRLGLRVPVYLLVTGCERLPGFGAFFAELPERLRDEMFGWSSPYGVDIAYRGEWVDEAFSSLRQELLAAQFEVFAERSRLGADAADAADAVFTFPDRLAVLREPLKVYFDRLFKASAYHESIFPRGLYFSGEDTERARSLFVRDLFERKIFPEHTLARPTARTFLTQRRAVIALQTGVAAGLLVLGLGLWRADVKLDRSAVGLGQFLATAGDSLAEVADQRLHRQTPDPALLEARAFELFDRMSQIDTNWFGSVFVPTSWFSPFNAELQRAIGYAYDRIICEALATGLDRKARLLTERPPQPAALAGSEAERITLPIESNPEFQNLREYVGQVVALEVNGGRYDGLGRSENLKDLDAVVRYVFGRPLPPRFFDESEIYRTALRYVRERQFHGDQYREKVRLEAEELESRLYRGLFRENPQMAGMKALSQAFDAVGEEGPGEEERLEHLLDEIQKLEATLGRPELAPLSSPDFRPGPPFERVLAEMSGSALLGADFANQGRELGSREQRTFREALATFGTAELHPFLAYKEGKWESSADLKLLAQALTDFLRQSSTTGGAPTRLATRLVPGHRLVWDTRRLAEAVALYEPYKNFAEHSLSAFPAGLRQRLQALAAVRVGDGILDRTARAQLFEPASAAASPQQLEQSLHEQADSFALAAKPLAELRDVFSDLHLVEPAQGLSDLTTAQGGAILFDLDRLLDAEGLYLPRQGGFSWWDGTRPLAARAYATGDPAELPAYLESQRERIAYLTRQYAEPVIKAIGHGDVREPDLKRRLDKWSGISAELYKYDGKKPGNSVAGLEGLLLQDLEEVDVATCGKTIPAKSLNPTAGDWFARTATHLRREVYQRCQVLAGGEAVDGYARLASLFNQRLAGRFPFSDGLPGRTDAEAEPDAIRDFFTLFDRTAPMVLAAPVKTGQTGAGSAREFVVAMERVRAFFAPFLDGEGKARPPVYDVDVDFRVDREDEIEGNQVIRWQMEAGDRRVTPKDAPRRLRWTTGLPVAVALGWAKDSPFVPLDPDGQEAAERTAVFRHANRWSLLALLRAHVPEAAEAGDLKPHTLEFVVPFKSLANGAPAATGTPAVPGAKSRSRVFLRLTLFGPEKDKKEELRLPDFPVRAPPPPVVPGIPSNLRLPVGGREEASGAP